MNKGISQETRKNKALNESYVSLDERSMLDLVQFTLNFSQFVNFYSLQNKVIDNWKPFMLNDSAFIIAMIASTDTNKYKIIIDDSGFQADETCEFEMVNKATNKIIELVTQWSALLNRSNYNGSLLKEVDKLMQSIKVKKSLQDSSSSIEVVKETYDVLYGNIVFVKEKASRNFETEILSDSNHHPHVGLLLAFFKLFQNVQQDINSVTKKHLDFYYKDLLQQKRKKLAPASAILGLQMLGGTEELVINEGDICEFSIEGNQQYRFNATSTTQISKAEIVEIRTLYKSDYHPFSNDFEDDDFSINRLYEADILKEDSTKGSEAVKFLDFPATLGEKPKHNDNVESRIKLSDIGIVISSPALILEKGTQEINLTFKITPVSYAQVEDMFEGLAIQEIVQENWNPSDKEKLKKRIVSQFFKEAFLIYITGNDGWKKVENFKTKTNNVEQTLSFDIQLIQQEDILISFDSEIHEGDFETEWPCIKLLLNNDVQYHPYKFLKDIVIENTSIKATVSEVSNLTLSNSVGNLDNSILFAPFGPTPVVGSYLRFQNPLILQKNLTSLEFHWKWAGLPNSRNGFADYYRAYPNTVDNKIFKAAIAQNRNIVQSSGKQDEQIFELFETEDERLRDEKKISINLDSFDFKNQIDPSKISIDKNASQLFIILTHPNFAFGHHLFTNIYAEAAMKSSRFKRKKIELPNQPYTPTIESLVVKYSNLAKEVMLRKQDNKGSDIKLIHIYPFGQVQVFPGPIKSQSFLFPQIEHKGNLFLGLKHISAGEILSVGFDLMPAVYMHTVINLPLIQWEYLSNNEWVALGDLLLEDSTDGLIKSGIVTIKMPQTIQIDNTRLPQGKFWIRAVYSGSEDLNSRIKNVFTQAVAVTSNNSGSDLDSEFSAESKIEKISFIGKKGIGKITGPFALETNNTMENEASFYSRISEQLRHKNRVVSNWDVERIVLDRFKNIEKVRVYGRNSHPKELVKGSSLQIVLIPKNNLIDRERKQSNNVDFSTLIEVKKYISQFVSPYVKVEVANPVYEQLKVRCSVKFHNFQKRGYFRNVLNDELISYLSPDIENSFIEKGFDESISKSEILNFIESRPYVDFISEFSVLQLVEVQGKYKILDTAKIERIKALRTVSPYAILTSAPEHQIEIISEEIPSIPKVSGIGDLSIGSDFIISDADGKYN